MKRFLLYAAIVLAVFGSISQADAKDPEDQEFRHVVVTLKSGEKVEGYLHRGWHAEGALLKQENYSFKITKTPEDKEVIKFTADSVISVDYTETTEVNPRDDGGKSGRHSLGGPRYCCSRTHESLPHLSQTGLCEQGRSECNDLLVEDVDDGTSR